MLNESISYLSKILMTSLTGWKSGTLTLYTARVIVTVVCSVVCWAPSAEALPSAELSEKEYTCLFQAVYYEARSEDINGQIAVATVVLNRVKSGKYGGDSICSVVKKRIAVTKLVCAFSFTCHQLKKVNSSEASVVTQAVELALKGLIVRGTDNILFYHTDSVKPYWSKDRKFVIKIGRHLFYE